MSPCAYLWTMMYMNGDMGHSESVYSLVNLLDVGGRESIHKISPKHAQVSVFIMVWYQSILFIIIRDISLPNC